MLQNSKEFVENNSELTEIWAETFVGHQFGQISLHKRHAPKGGIVGPHT